MRLTRLEVRHYRGIQHLDLRFDEQGPTVLFGKNGSGKSSLLDCIAVMFDGLFSALHGSQKGRRRFTDDDITNGRPALEVTAELEVKGLSIPWTLRHSRAPDRESSRENLRALTAVSTILKRALGADAWSVLPLTVFYPVNRTVLDFPGSVAMQSGEDPTDAYDQSLGGGALDFRRFFERFFQWESRENSVRLRRSRSYRDPQLQAVRSAIERLTGFSKLYVDQTTSPNRLMLSKGRTRLAVNQLSDGEKGLFSLVGDLARRLATANLKAKKALDAPAIVLIDEVELHLHPEWQSRVVANLAETFRGAQFILSTHSPEVIGRVQRDAVYRLDRTAAGVTARHPRGAKGFDVNTILAMMDAPVRDGEDEQKLSHLFQLIDEGKLREARALRSEIARAIGDDEPELARAAVMITRREVLGR